MINPIYILAFSVFVILAILIWKWWSKDKTVMQKTITMDTATTATNTNTATLVDTPITTMAPPMLFAVNDDGNLDLTDFNGKILNSSYGPHPKTYINLLDQASNDVEEHDINGSKQFASKVGTTKYYEFGGKGYIINYTRL